MTRFLLLLCAAFLLAGCGAKGVTVVDKPGFVTMSQRMPQEMKARGLLRACLETHLSIMKRFNSMLAMAI